MIPIYTFQKNIDKQTMAQQIKTKLAKIVNII